MATRKILCKKKSISKWKFWFTEHPLFSAVFRPGAVRYIMKHQIKNIDIQMAKASLIPVT